jgi:hypothetical protein
MSRLFFNRLFSTHSIFPPKHKTMGFFSYTCAKTNLPVLASTSWGENEYSRVHILCRDGSIMQGYYDGYGRIDLASGGTLEEFDDAILSGQWKLVLSKFYAAETFAELGVSRHEPGQGHFHDNEKIEKWHDQQGFPSYQEYVQAFKDPTA